MPADRSKASRQAPIVEVGGDDDTDTLSSPIVMPASGIAFAPNITPGTFNDPPPPTDDVDAAEEDSMLFPPQADGSLPPRKSAHNKRKPENHIPRPPNAFILFRSAFIRSQHVSTGVETNHSTLSKIIGMTWQNLPNEERQIWHRKAKLAEEEHRIKFPQYAFRPLHSKKKGGKRKVREVGPKDQTRCAKIAELLVQGKKGKELDDAVKEFDKTHVPQIVMRFEAPITEESFKSPRSPSISIKQEDPSAPSKDFLRLRSVSASSRRSASTVPNCPSPLSTEILSLPVPLQNPDTSYFNVPAFSFDHAKDDQTFDFGQFEFHHSIPSSTTLYQFDTHSQGVHPLDNTFIQSSPPSNMMTPHLSVDTGSFANMKRWSRCDSPGSPSTNTNSMPTTPAYPGTPPPHGQFHSGFPQQHKASFDALAIQYSPYQDHMVPPSYDAGPGQLCDYSPGLMDQQDLRQVDLSDYSSFIGSNAYASLVG